MTVGLKQPAVDEGRKPLPSTGGRPPKRRRLVTMAKARPWLLLAPALALLAGLLLWPLARVFMFSLQDYGLRQIVSGKTKFIGLDNYSEVFGDSSLWTVVLPNTIGFAIVAVASTVIFGTLVALLMASLSPLWRTVVGSAVMVAWAMPAVTGTYVWIWIFDADQGLVNATLKGLGLMDESFNWFTNPVTFYGIVALNIVHHGFPFVAITVLAGLLGVPKEMLEAAEMDGAGPVRRFFQITYPTIKPVFSVVVILSTIWDFKVFAQIYLMPGGSGSNREVLNLGVWSYVESFGQNRYGFGAAIAVLLTVLLLIITAIYVRTLFKEEKV